MSVAPSRIPAPPATAAFEVSPSLLIAGLSPPPVTRSIDPDALHDLALDQLVARVASVTDDALAAVLTVPLREPAEVERRQDIFRALESPATRAAVTDFVAQVAHVRIQRTAIRTSGSRVEAELWHLRSAATYLDALVRLAAALPEALDEDEASSEALRAVADWCAARVASSSFRHLRGRVAELTDAVSGVIVAMWLQGATVTIGHFDDELDDVAIVRETFARFGQALGPSPVETPRPRGMDEVQTHVLAMTAQLHPDVFDAVHAFVGACPDVTDEVGLRFADEAELFLAYLDVLAPIRAAGLPVCYPHVAAGRTALVVDEVYDLVLATGLVAEQHHIVTNTVRLAADERLLVVTGPNQGGKTTLARTIGQLHHLASVGCPVPGSRVELGLADRVLTHFERPERLANLEGRLGEALHRLHDLLGAATDRSVVVLNEMFTSAALDDARFLSREILARVRDLGALAVCVTFLDELAAFDEHTVSMVAGIDPEDLAVRTFTLTRRPADGRAYARALAARHGLDADTIRAHLLTDGSGKTGSEVQS